MELINSKLLKRLQKLEKDGKLRSIPDNVSAKAFAAIRKEVEPLHRDSKLKQASSERKARDKHFNM